MPRRPFTFRFTLLQLILVFPLVAILLALFQSHGCGWPWQRLTYLTFTSDGKTLVAGMYDGRTVHEQFSSHDMDIRRTVELIHLDDGYRQSTLEQEQRRGTGAGLAWPPCRFVAASPDDNTLATVGFDHTVRFWDVSKQQEKAFPTAFYGEELLGYSPDGKKLASAGLGAEVGILDLASGNVQWHDDYQAVLLSFSPDGRHVALDNYDGVRILDADTMTPIYEIPNEKTQATEPLFSPDGKTLAIQDRKLVRLWDVESRQTRSTLHEPLGEYQDPYRGARMAFSPDGETLAIAGEQGVGFWDVKTAKRRVPYFGGPNIMCLAFSPDGKLLATADVYANVTFWDVNSRQPIYETSLAFSRGVHFMIPLICLPIWFYFWRKLTSRQESSLERKPSASPPNSS